MSAVFKSDAGEQTVLSLYRKILREWPIPCEQALVSTREGDTFVLICGDKGLPPLVLLHGAQANSAGWMFDMPIWSQHFRVYAIDMIGEAGLSAQTRPRLEGDAHALWLGDVLQGLVRDERFCLLGVSLGGWLALDFARRYPEQIKKLVLLCPAGIGRQKLFFLKYGPLLLLGRWGLRKMREAVLGPTPAQLPDQARPLVRLMQLIGSNIRSRILKIPVLADAQLRRLSMPLLCIVGGRDVLLDSAETQARLKRLAPQAEVRFLPEARHFPRGQSQNILAFLLGYP